MSAECKMNVVFEGLDGIGDGRLFCLRDGLVEFRLAKIDPSLRFNSVEEMETAASLANEVYVFKDSGKERDVNGITARIFVLAGTELIAKAE
jgi:hypothetical protein